MRVIRSIGGPHPPTVLTIGNFDGVHRGHQVLLRLVRERADEAHIQAAALTFEPHPREFFTPQSAPPRLSTLREKLLALADSGLDRLHVLRFDLRLARLGAADFIETLLVRSLNVQHLVIGDDFRFGARRGGGLAELLEAGERFGFTVEPVPEVRIDGLRVSSSLIRTLVAEGKLEQAARLLGRPYRIEGRVVHGEKLGRTLGFPTANIPLSPRRLAPPGVYVCSVAGLAASPLPAVANIGLRPTVGGLLPRLEVHLLDWSGECYGRRLCVAFFHKLREERKFPDLDALRAQIAEDVVHARQWHRHHRAAFPVPEDHP
ncbi:MAG: bifunctional riboflavin kinase/FAD synthetase [Rhodocyclales bacterium]|nr:bifunctional riboflavin kinase/FAD synthetase [Rhodocyclales bacterium]